MCSLEVYPQTSRDEQHICVGEVTITRWRPELKGELIAEPPLGYQSCIAWQANVPVKGPAASLRT